MSPYEIRRNAENLVRFADDSVARQLAIHVSQYGMTEADANAIRSEVAYMRRHGL
jgi:hypothetical protein